MPVKLGLKPVAIIRTYSLDSEWKLIDDVVNKINGTGFVVLHIDFKCLDTFAVVNRDILDAFNTLLILIF